KAQEILRAAREKAAAVVSKGTAVVGDVAVATVSKVGGATPETVKQNVRNIAQKGRDIAASIKVRSQKSEVRSTDVIPDPWFDEDLERAAGVNKVEEPVRSPIEVPKASTSVNYIPTSDNLPRKRVTSANLGEFFDSGDELAPIDRKEQILDNLIASDSEVKKSRKGLDRLVKDRTKITAEISQNDIAIKQVERDLLAQEEKYRTLQGKAKEVDFTRTREQQASLNRDVANSERELLDLAQRQNDLRAEREKLSSYLKEQDAGINTALEQDDRITADARSRYGETAEALSKSEVRSQELEVAKQDLQLAELRNKNAQRKVSKPEELDKLKQEYEAARTAEMPEFDSGIASSKVAGLDADNLTTENIDRYQQAEAKYKTAIDNNKNAVIAANAVKAKKVAVTAAETAATAAQTTAEALYRKNVEATLLAEQGLIKSRVFGRAVLVSNTGALGKLNKVLATEISFTQAATAAKVKYAAVTTSVTKNSQGATGILAKLASIDVWGGITGGAKLAGGGIKNVGAGVANLASGVTGLSTQFLGLAGTLALPVAFGLAAFREELFGVGKEVDRIEKEYRELIASQEEIGQKYIKRAAGKELIEALDSGKDLRVEVDRLASSSRITTDEQQALAAAIDKVGSSGSNNKQAVAELRSEINKLGSTDLKKVEGSVYDVSWGQIGKDIGNMFDFVVNSGSTALQALTVKIGQNPIEIYNDTAASRDADRFLKTNNLLLEISQDTYDKQFKLRQGAFSVQTLGAIDTELQKIIATGDLFTQNRVKELAAKRGTIETTIAGLEDRLNKVNPLEREQIQLKIEAQKAELDKVKVEENAAKDRDKIVAKAIDREKEYLAEQKEGI
ncbi:MAG: hypothetical protein ACRC2V_13195, partial [Xenococcaceae cyanobacterium]